MRPLLLFAMVTAIACNPQNKEETPTSDSTSTSSTDTSQKTEVMLPYEAHYSAKFEMGNPEQVRIVGELWKAFDNNTFDDTKKYFADSVYMLLADGTELYGPADSIVSSAKHARGKYSKVRSEVAAWFPIKSTDKNEHWVGVWGWEVDTQKGKTDSVNLHEVWQFNNDNRVVAMRQFAGKMPTPKK